MIGLTRLQAGNPRVAVHKPQILFVFWMHQPFECVQSEVDCVIAIGAQEMSPQSAAYTKSSHLDRRPRQQESRSSLTDRAGQRPR